MGQRGVKISSSDGKEWTIICWGAGYPYGYKEHPPVKMNSLYDAYVAIGGNYHPEEIQINLHPDWLQKQLNEAKQEVKRLEELEITNKEIAEMERLEKKYAKIKETLSPKKSK
jgi:hypothetical protein